jgi:hypothetical protein
MVEDVKEAGGRDTFVGFPLLWHESMYDLLGWLACVSLSAIFWT